MRVLLILDEYTLFLGHRFQNSIIAFYIGIFQLLVCLWSLTQHIYSIFWFKKVLYCDFTNSTEDVIPVLTKVDAIIFDVGLFHSLWGISRCVAEHLDGGYGRFLWCLCHTFALLFCLPFAFVQRPKPQTLWPLLIQQSAYGVGLLILSLAALPKILPTFMGDITKAPVASIIFYLFGSSMNFFLLYIYWHWYWYVEAEWDISMRKTYTSDFEIDKRKISALCDNKNFVQRKIATDGNVIRKNNNDNVFPIYNAEVTIKSNHIVSTNSVEMTEDYGLHKNDNKYKMSYNDVNRTPDLSLNTPLLIKGSFSDSYDSSLQSPRNTTKNNHKQGSVISPLSETMYTNLVNDYNDIIVPISDDDSINDNLSKSTEELDVYPQNIYDPRVGKLMKPKMLGKASLQLYHTNTPSNYSFHHSVTDYAFSNKMSPYSSRHTSPRNDTPTQEAKFQQNNHNPYKNTYRVYDY
uniref:XK-related protein n=1 Tax=Strongyloides venezuelensis TaxID=75913 RepID=A0A0K0FR02_STRVS